MQEGSKKRRQRRNASRATNLSGETLDQAIDEFMKRDTVGVKDSSHRGLSLWAIDTFNPNAWPGAAEVLVSTSADVAMVQEARVEAASVADVESSTRNLGWKMSISACNYGSG